MHHFHMKMPILCFILREKSHFSLYQKRSVTPKYDKNAFVAGGPPRTPLGELTTLTPPPHTSHPAPLGTLGARYLALSVRPCCEVQKILKFYPS